VSDLPLLGGSSVIALSALIKKRKRGADESMSSNLCWAKEDDLKIIQMRENEAKEELGRCCGMLQWMDLDGM
jgi:hypothetical protein